MKDNDIQKQIDAVNMKLDIILEEVTAQKEVRQNISDLTADLSIVTKDVFGAAVTELDNSGVEIDGEAIKILLLKIVRNIDTLNELFNMIESGYDFIKDITPIIHQVGLDGIKTMNRLEARGYIDFFKESLRIVTNIVENFTVEDVRLLADNIVIILETVKNLTQPEMLEAVNNGTVVYKSMKVTDIPEYSLFRALREMNSPELKKGLGFMISFLKNIAKEESDNN